MADTGPDNPPSFLADTCPAASAVDSPVDIDLADTEPGSLGGAASVDPSAAA